MKKNRWDWTAVGDSVKKDRVMGRNWTCKKGRMRACRSRLEMMATPFTKVGGANVLLFKSVH